jgi:excisionase family DNA binding protein
MQDAQQPEGLTIAEAAAHLGVSSDTVRRRIRRGDLSAMQVHTPNGPAWRVLLGALPSAVPTLDGAHSSAAMHVEAPLLAQLLADAQAELVRKAEAAAMWQARAEFLAGQLEQAQLALAAPKEMASHQRPQISDSDGLTAETTQTPATTPQRVPWWLPWRRVTS